MIGKYTEYIKDLSYNLNLQLAKRLRYKTVTEDYFHYILNGYRIESAYTHGYYITCIVKCGSPRESNSTLYQRNTVCIASKDNIIIYNEDQFNNIITQMRLFKKGRKL